MTLTFTEAPLLTVVDESIKVSVSAGAVPFQCAAGTNFSWSVLARLSALAVLLIVTMVVQVVPLLEYCQLPLDASAV